MTEQAVEEHVLLLPCEGEQLLAVLAERSDAAQATLGAVIVVGGPQVRAGSHRQFVRLARALAADGCPTLRFDVRGMGDSSGAPRSFEAITPDIGAAVDALMAARPGLRQVVLWGLCDGASAALLYLDERADTRVAGLALANPWVRTPGTHARTRLKHYYLQRLTSADFWRKALAGRVGVGALREMAGTARAAGSAGPAAAAPAYTERMTRCAAALDRPLLLLMSGSDYTAREFDEFSAASRPWQQRLRSPLTQRADFADADHTFSREEDLERSIHATCRWVRQLAQPSPP